MHFKKVYKYIIYTVIIVIFLICYGFYSFIHTDVIEKGKMDYKINCENKIEPIINGEKLNNKKDYAFIEGEYFKCKKDYYIVVEDKILVIEDKNTWNLLNKDDEYNFKYEWYGFKTPIVKSINLVKNKSKSLH